MGFTTHVPDKDARIDALGEPGRTLVNGVVADPEPLPELEPADRGNSDAED